jgi:transposase
VSDLRAELASGIAELRAQRSGPPERRESYSTAEVAGLVGKSEYTVRQWCNERRIEASKRPERRGMSAIWSISADEVARYRNEGLLPAALSPNAHR